MKLSLSVRIAEGFLSKEHPEMDLEAVADLAASAGFEAICMRASQVGVHSSDQDVLGAVRILRERNLPVSMVTGDFDIVYNNDDGPNCLRNIGRYVRLATTLSAPRIRVALKTDEDIPWAQRAADEAADAGVKLVHQCHTLSLFETVEGIEQTLTRIGRPNFGLVFEPANLEICGQDYGAVTIERLAPWIDNVYLQNQQLKPDGRITLNTWCRGSVSFDLIQIHEPGGIDFDQVFDGLARIGYDGTVTVHQSATGGRSPTESATATAKFLREKYLGNLGPTIPPTE